MATAKDFRGSRRTVAGGLLDGPATASQLARRLERSTGSFFGVLRRMVEEELVEADTVIPTRGTIYTLTPESREVLRAVEDRPPEPGLVKEGQRLVEIVDGGHKTAVARVVAGERGTDGIVWAAETTRGWLISLAVSDGYAADRLVMILERAGATVTKAGLVSAVLPAEDFKERAEMLLSEVENGP